MIELVCLPLPPELITEFRVAHPDGDHHDAILRACSCWLTLQELRRAGAVVALKHRNGRLELLEV